MNQKSLGSGPGRPHDVHGNQRGQVFPHAPVSLAVLGIGFLTERARMSMRVVVKSLFIMVLLVAFFAIIPFSRESTLLTGSVGERIAGLVSSVLGEFGGSILLITCLLLVLLAELFAIYRQRFSVHLLCILEFPSLPQPRRQITHGCSNVRMLVAEQ